MFQRLLPIFEQDAPDLAAGLRTQMTPLASYVPRARRRKETATSPPD